MNAALKIKDRASKYPLGSLVYTVVVTLVAVVLIVAGIIMLVVPGPGLLTIFLGLTLLGTEFPWARKLVTRIKDWAKPYVDRVLSWWRGRKTARALQLVRSGSQEEDPQGNARD